MAYAAGIFDGAPDGGSVDTDLNDGKDLAGRVFLSPFKKGSSALKDLGFGIAGTTGKQSGPLPAYRSGGQISVITILTGITADGDAHALLAAALVLHGAVRAPGRVRAVRLEGQEGRRQPLQPEGQRLADHGDDRPHGRQGRLRGSAARRSRSIPRRASGARSSWRRGCTASSSTARASTPASSTPRSPCARSSPGRVGLNWSLSRNVKQVVDFEHVSFKGGAAAGADRESENIVFIRTQLSF